MQDWISGIFSDVTYVTSEVDFPNFSSPDFDKINLIDKPEKIFEILQGVKFWKIQACCTKSRLLAGSPKILVLDWKFSHNLAFTKKFLCNKKFFF